MNANQPNHCPQCGQTISQGVKGLCPNCLALIAFGPDESAAPTVLSRAVGAAALPKNLDQTNARPLLSLSARYFGDYELEEEIARGGMGVVYRARQVSLNRIVAVKMILSGQLADETDVQRLLAEAEAAANLQHPNIVAIHEVGQHEGQYYFSMDYVEGKNLADYGKLHSLPASQAAQLVKTIAEAAHYAHQRGTLHRDLKPQNVLMDVNGQPRITDFGLAKRVERDGALTQSGAVLGSPSYMPPEQATGRHNEVGPSSDVYSLGAILYQLLTGKAPFKGTTPLEIIRQVVETEPIAPSKTNHQTPPDLETICLKCLEKRPERRYHSARELAEELGRFLRHEPILAKPASAWRKAWTWFRQNPWALIGAAALAVLALLGFAYGLWERVKFLEGRTSGNLFDAVPLFKLARQHIGSEFSLWANLSVLTGYFVMLPGLLFGRWLSSRRHRNLPVSNPQLALLAGTGLLLIALGLWSDLMLIRLFVWKKTMIESWAGIVGWSLGFPLVCCWVGGGLIWQAIRFQQAHWSGSTTVEKEWMPRQAVPYSTVAFVLATIGNLLLFVLAAYLGIVTGIFEPVLKVVGSSHEGKVLLSTCFALIAVVVSTACWIVATRKVCQRPTLVSVFLGLFLAGSIFAWFFSPPYSALPPAFVLTSMLAGLAGGWVLVKSVKIKKVETSELVSPLVFGDLFQCDRRALTIALAAVAIVLGSCAGLFFRKGLGFPNVVGFLVFAVLNLLWPTWILAARITTGQAREFFRSILVGMFFLGILAPALTLGLAFDDKPGVIPTLMWHWLGIILLGNAAGCALIYFGRIRPKAR